MKPAPSPKAARRLRAIAAALTKADARRDELIEERRTIWWSEAEVGVTSAALAECSGVPHGTVRSQLSRARQT